MRMTTVKKLFNFGRIWRLAAATLVIAASLVVFLPQPAFAASKCYDSFIGQAYNCPDTPGYPIDKKEGESFKDGACYSIADPDVGWITTDCNKDYFKRVVEDNRIKQAPQKDCPERLESSGGCDIIGRYFNPAITAVTVVIGTVLVCSFGYGAIQYGSARDNPQAISAAKSRMANTVLVFLGYSLLWSFLQWLIPGGLFE